MRKSHYIYLAVVVMVSWIAFGWSPVDALAHGGGMFGVTTLLADRAAIVQRDMVQAVQKFRPEKARTLATFEQGTRKKTARLAGLQMGYWKDHAHGQTLYSPMAGDNSFKKSTKQTTGAMYAGVVFRNMNIQLEAHIQKDMERGFIPDSYIAERRRRIATHQMKKNWAAIHDGTAGLAKVATDASGSTITLLADNSARGTSKGSFRLKPSTAADPLYYDCVDSSDTVTATFYVSAILSATTVTAAGFTVGAITDIDTGDWICESGQWKKELLGIAGHNSDSTSRIYQGADVSVDTFLQNMAIDAGNAAPTPTLIHSAKSVMMTRANETEEFGWIAHITQTNLRELAKFGYTLRTVDQNNKSAAMRTIGLPNVYEDGDTVFVPDADYEECYIDFREKSCFFEYVQKEFGLKVTGGVSRHEYAGTNNAGSTTEYENYNEACQIVWDSKGKDGDGEDGGIPNTGVIIKNIALPSVRQNVYGV